MAKHVVTPDNGFFYDYSLISSHNYIFDICKDTLTEKHGQKYIDFVNKTRGVYSPHATTFTWENLKITIEKLDNK